MRFDADAPALETPRALVDLTRLIRGRRRRFGTGVDRIDLALALALARRLGPGCGFVHASPLGPVLLAPERGRALLAALERRWRGEAAEDATGDPKGGAATGSVPGSVPGSATGNPLLRARLGLGARRVLEPEATTYVCASHSGLPARPGALDRLDPSGRMRRLIYVHDLIPIDYPEYQRPGSDARLARLLDEAAARPARFLTNSADTARRLAAHARDRGWRVEGIAPLIPRPDPPAPAPEAALGPAARAVLAAPGPYFVALGTIEPRKNHLLLLHVWRELAAEERAPRLVVIGRRGWENEMVVDMLERCAAIRPHVLELGDLRDAEAQALLARARALLLPSFAEGLGVPLMEAAALGTPAVASDLPALREVAAPGTAFLSPLDGPGWRREVLARAG